MNNFQIKSEENDDSTLFLIIFLFIIIIFKGLTNSILVAKVANIFHIAKKYPPKSSISIQKFSIQKFSFIFWGVGA